jgi:cell fate regulator YaaT (PSP1 superfamily)
MSKIIGVKLQEWGKVFYYDAQQIELLNQDQIIIETDEGLGLGTVRLLHTEQIVNQQSDRLRKVIRKANDEDLMQLERNKEKENTAFTYCRDKIERLNLNMKLVNVDYLFDGSKATFYFTAEERVDFRELVKDLASYFHTRIELRQVGVRDEARIKGGIGPCGRRLCCSTWIDNFEPVSVKMAKVQKLSLNPANISGMCGRLMCCLAYEYQNYVSGEMKRAAAAKEKEKEKEKEEKKLEIYRAEQPLKKTEPVPERKKEGQKKGARKGPQRAKEASPKKGRRDWKRYKQKKGKKTEGKKD